MFGHWIYKSGTREQQEKDGFLNKRSQLICLFMWKEINLDIDLSPFTKLNVLVIHLNVKGKTINLLEGSVGDQKTSSWIWDKGF